MTQVDPCTINCEPIISTDSRRHFHGRVDHTGILTSLCTRIVAIVVTELADYIGEENKRWTAALQRAGARVLKILQEQEKEIGK